jgi:hypothetical protein
LEYHFESQVYVSVYPYCSTEIRNFDLETRNYLVSILYLASLLLLTFLRHFPVLWITMKNRSRLWTEYDIVLTFILLWKFTHKIFKKNSVFIGWQIKLDTKTNKQWLISKIVSHCYPRVMLTFFQNISLFQGVSVNTVTFIITFLLIVWQYQPETDKCLGGCLFVS